MQWGKHSEESIFSTTGKAAVAEAASPPLLATPAGPSATCAVDQQLPAAARPAANPAGSTAEANTVAAGGSSAGELNSCAAPRASTDAVAAPSVGASTSGAAIAPGTTEGSGRAKGKKKKGKGAAAGSGGSLSTAEDKALQQVGPGWEGLHCGSCSVPLPRS